MSHEDNHAEHDNQQPPHEEQNSTQTDPTPDSDEGLDYAAFSDEIDKEHAPDTQTQPSEEQVRIKLLEEELERTKDQMMRAVAEAENGRKRALKEREDASKFAVSGFSRDVLSVADNLRRALEAIPAELLEQNDQVKSLTDGIEATERELLRCFEKNGIQKTDPLDERF